MQSYNSKLTNRYRYITLKNCKQVSAVLSRLDIPDESDGVYNTILDIVEYHNRRLNIIECDLKTITRLCSFIAIKGMDEHTKLEHEQQEMLRIITEEFAHLIN